jgi:hypothetical protein
MKSIWIAFGKFKVEKMGLPIGFQQIQCYMIFDVKLGENFIGQLIMLLLVI